MKNIFFKTAVFLGNIVKYVYTHVPLESTTNETQSQYVSDVLDLLVMSIIQINT